MTAPWMNRRPTVAEVTAHATAHRWHSASVRNCETTAPMGLWQFRYRSATFPQFYGGIACLHVHPVSGHAEAMLLHGTDDDCDRLDWFTPDPCEWRPLTADPEPIEVPA